MTEKRTTCLVLELITGGELFDYITANGRIEENEAIRMFRQMISAIEYTHYNGVIHRGTGFSFIVTFERS